MPVRGVLCAGDRCRVLDGDKPLYFDTNHLSMHGASLVAPAVLKRLGGAAAAAAAAASGASAP